jgi:hypothetical protein
VLARNPDPKKVDVDCKAYVNQEVKKANDRIDSLKNTSNATAKKTDEIEKRLVSLDSLNKKNAEQSHTTAKKVEELEKRLAAADKIIADQSKQIQTLREWVEDKWELGKGELARANEKADQGIRTGSYSLWLIIPISAAILFVLGFFFWPRKTVSALAVDVSGLPKCPRCGREHDPADTICKNPACKTQF